MAKIKRALLSVFDKSGIVELANFLAKNGVEILSTGGTQKALGLAGIPVTPIEDYTQYPEMMNGRVKTLHPKIHAGILNLRDNQEHQQAMQEHDIQNIDLVVVNLYPFEKTIAKADVTLSEAIENIDIGGPTMVRAAAKNYQHVAVVVDPADYEKVIFELNNNQMEIPAKYHFEFAAKAFSHTASYDAAISNYLNSITKVQEHPERQKFSKTLTLPYKKIFDLRYGENPHQQAAYYSEGWHDEPCIGNARQLHGKHLSYNNFLDLDAALETVKEFEKACCVIVKHNNPCGVATTEGDIAEAFKNAMACDPTSSFGGIIAFNREVSLAAAEEIHQSFFEAVIAPDFEAEALELLKQKKNIRLLKTLPIRRYEISGWDMKKVVGGLLVQDRDTQLVEAADAKVVTKRAPSAEEIQGLDFAWRLCKHVKSNAIVYTTKDRSIGIGAGQMSRVDSVKLAAEKAQSDLKNCVMASDAFFPFRDNVDLAAEYGIKAIIQPGGSIRDEEVIAAADEYNIAMVFTGMRHFRH